MRRAYRVIIVGAGASGLMLASLLPDKKDILLIDSNPRIGAKVSISGGGKCNLTNQNVGAEHYVGLDWFVQYVLSRFDQDAVLAWFIERGLDLELRDSGQYFCRSSADKVLEIFRRELAGVAMQLGTRVTGVLRDKEGFMVKTDRGTVAAEHLVMASGGLSFPRIGASGIGFDVAGNFAHQVKPLAPALVGFTVQKAQFFFKDLTGASIPVVITVGERVCSGDLLFTHKGISGPAVLNASLYWSRGNISIDFLPHFSFRDIRSSKKHLSSLLPFPKKVARCFLDTLDIADKPAEHLSSETWEALSILHCYSFAPAGTFGYAKAEVTRGGVVCDEVDPHSMMSLKTPNLYFVGEVLDVTGELGGYNFQWAFSSASVCAENIGGLDV